MPVATVHAHAKRNMPEEACAAMPVLHQFSSTCAFNAMFMCLFYSDGGRAVMRQAMAENGQTRNLETGKCQALTIKKAVSVKTVSCPPGKELNMKTKRCVKKCLPHQKRDLETRKCIAVKKKATTTKCPVGEERSIKTGKCVKKCKPGQARNTDTGRCRNKNKNKNTA